MATNFLDQLIGYGDEAARDALSLSTGEEGALWLNTDTGKVERWGGAAWEGLTITADGILAGSTDSYVLTADSSAATGLAWTEVQARKVEAYVKNDEATSITKGQIVYISGGATSAPLVKLALADSDTTSARTMGFAIGTITASGFGYVQTHGLIENVSTSGLADGDLLFLSASTAGGYTNVRPTQPNHGVVVGVTVKGGSGGAGSIFIFVQNGPEITELHDVLIPTTPAEKDVLSYDATATVWKNRTLSAAGIATSDHTHGSTETINIIIDGGGTAITTGVKADVLIPYASTITAARLLADQTGSIVVDIWKDTYANFPPTAGDSITASAKPTLSSGFKYEDTTLTGWTASLTAGDYLRVNVDSATTVTRVVLVLTITRSIS